MALLVQCDDSEALRSQLTFEHELFDATIAQLRLYRHVGDGQLLIPKCFFEADAPDVPDVPDAPDAPGFLSSLRPHQIGAARAMLARVLRSDCALVHLYTGFGKTVLALWLVACLQPLQTTVYVHKHSLALQWEGSISQFLSAELGENVAVKTVQGQLNRLEEMHETTQGTLVIFDEVHHMCAHSFSQLLFHSRAQWHLGLSATERRKDGLHAALHCLLGKPCVSITALRHKPLVYRSFFKGPPGLYDFRMQRVRGREVVNFPHAVSMLCESPERNQHIMDILRRLRSRNVLVLSHRRSHASTLADMATDLAGVDVRLLLGQMKDSEIRSATAPPQGPAVILVATAQAAGEGFDMPILDTVLFATPASDVSQETGRVLRCAGSNHPLVIDIVDGAGVYMALYRKRKVFYDSQELEFTDHCPGTPAARS